MMVYLYKLIYNTNTEAIGPAFGIEVFIAVIGGCFIPFAAYRLCHTNLNRIKEFYRKNSWGILLFVVLFLEFVFNKSENLRAWGSCWYGVNYSMA